MTIALAAIAASGDNTPFRPLFGQPMARPYRMPLPSRFLSSPLTTVTGCSLSHVVAVFSCDRHRPPRRIRLPRFLSTFPHSCLPSRVRVCLRAFSSAFLLSRPPSCIRICLLAFTSAYSGRIRLLASHQPTSVRVRYIRFLAIASACSRCVRLHLPNIIHQPSSSCSSPRGHAHVHFVSPAHFPIMLDRVGSARLIQSS